MKAKLLTDAELRAVWPLRREKTYRVPEGTLLTPSARDYVRENGIELVYEQDARPMQTMTVTKIPVSGGRPRFQDAATGESMTEKPEHMTHLRGNLLVPKTHPRIAFRGRLDSLTAQVLLTQLYAQGECPSMVPALEEVLGLLREIMSAEVNDRPLARFTLLGLDGDDLRRASHRIREELGIDHPTPAHTMGMLCMQLNLLRTRIREVELCAVSTFTENGVCVRGDIVQALNRLSSGIYLLFCRKVSGYYDKGQQA